MAHGCSASTACQLPVAHIHPWPSSRPRPSVHPKRKHAAAQRGATRCNERLLFNKFCSCCVGQLAKSNVMVNSWHAGQSQPLSKASSPLHYSAWALHPADIPTASTLPAPCCLSGEQSSALLQESSGGANSAASKARAGFAALAGPPVTQKGMAEGALGICTRTVAKANKV